MSAAPRPRVLLWHWGRRGGGPRYTFELARALAARGQFDLRLSLSRQCEIYREFEALPIERFDVDTYDSLGSAALSLLRLPAVRARFWRDVQQAGVDVVVNTMSHLWDVPVLAGRTRRPPFVMVLHDAAPHPGEDLPLRHWLLRREVAATRGVITLTEHVRRMLCETYPYPAARTRVVPHGIFPYAGESPPRRGTPVRLLFFGRLLPYKGLDLLLDAMALLAKQDAPVALHIAGPGDIAPYRERLARLANVTVDNRWIPEDAIGGIFSAADISVLPYREASQSGVIATSYAVGVPVVVTPIGGLGEQVRDGETGLVAQAATPEAIAAAIARLARDEALRLRCAEGSRAEARDALSWPAIARRFETALAELVGTPSPRTA